jgi:hypothetical protein
MATKRGTEQRTVTKVKHAKLKTVDLSHRSGRSVPYEGPRVGCTFCCYESRGLPAFPIAAARRATLIFDTATGPRELCAFHARLGAWR